MQKIMNTLSCCNSPEGTTQPTDPTAELRRATFETTPVFTLEGTHVCKVIDIYDGDTFTVATDLPGQGLSRIICRLEGIDTAEMRYPQSEAMREQLKALAYNARNRAARELINLPEDFPPTMQMKRGDLRRICGESERLISVIFGGMDKYGRCLVSVPVGDTTLSQILIDEGLALPYDGGHKGNIYQLLID